MGTYFILLPVAITSWGMVLLLRRRGIPGAGWRSALARVLECVGLTVLFAGGNTVLGATLTLLARALTQRFVSLYLTTDSVLLALSALQAVMFRWWWGSGGSVPTEAQSQNDADTGPTGLSDEASGHSRSV